MKLTKEEAYVILCSYREGFNCIKNCPLNNGESCSDEVDVHQLNAIRKLKEYIRELDEIEK